MEKLLTAEEYLSHFYEKPTEMPKIPLADENFLSAWSEAEGAEVLNFLSKNFNLPTNKFDWKNKPAMKIEISQTLGGKLPVITTADHDDFCKMVALLNDRDFKKYPLTVNAFTMQTKAEKIFRHRVILLNYAPYSNVSAEKLNLSAKDWLEKSQKLRMRHEAAHYETLRIFGGMKNHALDEILADTLGQIAAFGNFSAERQKLFFGLKGDECDGRLNFYLKKVKPEEITKIYRAVNSALDKFSVEIKNLLNSGSSDLEIFEFIACKKI